MTLRLFMLCVALSAVGLVACGKMAGSPKPAVTGTPPPERVSLPFSWEDQSLRFTIFDVAPATQEEEQGAGPLEGYRQYVMHFEYENLLNEDLQIGEGGAGFDYFKLKTDQGNVYEPRFVGGFPVFGSLRPRSVVTSANYVFEIRTDEAAAELLAYDDIESGLAEELRLAYTFVLK